MDLVGDDTRAESREGGELGGIDGRGLAGAKVGRVAVVLAQGRPAPEVDLERVFGPVGRERQCFVEARPRQQFPALARFTADVQRLLAEILRAERGRIERREELREIHGARR